MMVWMCVMIKWPLTNLARHGTTAKEKQNKKREYNSSS